MQLLTKQIRKDLDRNMKLKEEDRKPVVKFFAPWGAATWLISEFYPERQEMFGLCDTGHGSPELGSISFSELQIIRGPMGLMIERDIGWSTNKTLAQHADEARKEGSIAA